MRFLTSACARYLPPNILPLVVAEWVEVGSLCSQCGPIIFRRNFSLLFDGPHDCGWKRAWQATRHTDLANGSACSVFDHVAGQRCTDAVEFRAVADAAAGEFSGNGAGRGLAAGFDKIHPRAAVVRFSNRPVGVKRFQTIHHCSVDVAHGLVLLFGIGTKAVPSWDSRTRRNNLLGGLTVSVTAGPSGQANSPHPSSREGHLSTARWNSRFLLSY